MRLKNLKLGLSLGIQNVNLMVFFPPSMLITINPRLLPPTNQIHGIAFVNDMYNASCTIMKHCALVALTEPGWTQHHEQHTKVQ